MRTRGTQKEVRQVEVSVDTVYIRSNIEPISEVDFKGWEYDEEIYSLKDYVGQLTNIADTQSMALLMSTLMNEIDTLKNKVQALEGGTV